MNTPPFASQINFAHSTNRTLVVSGLILLASGGVHIFIWMVFGGQWEGPVSWRKPILFGVSTGATLLSIAWVMNKLKWSPWDDVVCRILAGSLVAEVALITIQQWRGRASHFNHETRFDSYIEYSMTALIILATAILIQITGRTFVYLRAEKDLQLAIRGGMAFLILSCLIGFWVLFYGQSQVALGRDPSTFGDAGVTKFPHGVAIHAIQILPIFCWLLKILRMDVAQRIRLVSFCISAMSGFVLFSLVQTLSGRARFDVNLSGGLILVVTLSLLIPVTFSIVVRVVALLRQSVHSVGEASLKSAD